jgi:hypothetical protein
MAEFLHISFHFDKGGSKIEELKPEFNKALDWYRYAPNCWVVWTTTNAEGWYARLKPLLTDKDSMLVIPFEYGPISGVASRGLWDFFKKHLEKKKG